MGYTGKGRYGSHLRGTTFNLTEVGVGTRIHLGNRVFGEVKVLTSQPAADNYHLRIEVGQKWGGGETTRELKLGQKVTIVRGTEPGGAYNSVAAAERAAEAEKSTKTLDQMRVELNEQLREQGGAATGYNADTLILTREDVIRRDWDQPGDVICLKVPSGREVYVDRALIKAVLGLR